MKSLSLLLAIATLTTVDAQGLRRLRRVAEARSNVNKSYLNLANEVEAEDLPRVLRKHQNNDIPGSANFNAHERFLKSKKSTKAPAAVKVASKGSVKEADSSPEVDEIDVIVDLSTPAPSESPEVEDVEETSTPAPSKSPDVDEVEETSAPAPIIRNEDIAYMSMSMFLSMSMSYDMQEDYMSMSMPMSYDMQEDFMSMSMSMSYGMSMIYDRDDQMSMDMGISSMSMSMPYIPHEDYISMSMSMSMPYVPHEDYISMSMSMSMPYVPHEDYMSMSMSMSMSMTDTREDDFSSSPVGVGGLDNSMSMSLSMSLSMSMSMSM